jgi:hypothetical protein
VRRRVDEPPLTPAGGRSGTLIPTFGALFTNDTGAPITSLVISYVGEEWRFGTAGRADSLNFEYSLDSTDVTAGTWTGVSALDFITPNTGVAAGETDGNAAGFHTLLSSVLTGLNIAPGATFAVRWTDPDATSNDDGLAIDKFSITANGPAFVGLDDTPSYTEKTPSDPQSGKLTVLDDDATIVNAAAFDGATLTLARHGGANPNDVFDGSGTLDLTDGQVLLQEIQDNEPIDIIVGTYTNADGTLVITFNADATEARVNAVLEQIAYGYGGEAPPPTAVIDYAFNDGQSPVATGSITVTLIGQNDPPTLDGVAPQAAYQPGTAGVVLSPSVVVGDADSPTLAQAVVRIVDRPTDPFNPDTTSDTPDPDDVLSANPGGTGIGVSYNQVTHVLTLSGPATLDQFRQVLDTVTYSSPDADPSNGGASTTRTIEWQLDDGGASDNLSGVQTTTLHFTPTLDLDGSVAGSGYAAAFSENGPVVPIADTDAVVTNSGGPNLTFATITLTNAKPGDSLAIAGPLPGGITGTVDDTSVPGQIIVGLGGPASPANYKAALQRSCSAAPATIRTPRFATSASWLATTPQAATPPTRRSRSRPSTTRRWRRPDRRTATRTSSSPATPSRPMSTTRRRSSATASSARTAAPCTAPCR